MCSPGRYAANAGAAPIVCPGQGKAPGQFRGRLLLIKLCIGLYIRGRGIVQGLQHGPNSKAVDGCARGNYTVLCTLWKTD